MTNFAPAMLVNDLVVMEENCNMTCSYCLTGQSVFKKSHEQKRIFEPPRPASYADDAPLKARLDGALAAVEKNLALPVIKVTGGEILLIRGVVDFLERLAERYEIVVIQTNGVRLDADLLRRIRGWGNACLQISLDASDYEGNSHRSRTREEHAHALARIGDALQSEIGVEIYAVLNDRSLPRLECTLKWFAARRGNVVVCPFPVRGPDRDTFFPHRDDVEVLRSVVLGYERYAGVLPPRAYMLRLLRFFDEGGRTFRCHLPRFAFTTFDDGGLTPCPNIWFTSLGNVLQSDPEAAIAAIGTTAFHQVLTAERPRIAACKGCFTPWDLLSMYVDGEISLDELCRVPMYAGPRSRARIQEIAERWRRSC